MKEIGAIRKLPAIETASVAELMSIWRSRAGEEDGGSPTLFRTLGERILAQGEPLLAYDVIHAGRLNWPNDVRLRQLEALALARSGATERALVLLEALRHEKQISEETLGLLGRTYKDLAANATSQSERDNFVQNAAASYQQAYEISGGCWSGINAATMYLLLGNETSAQHLASDVRDQCLPQVTKTDVDRYWELAALGEAALICRDFDQATQWYRRAVYQGKNRYGDISSSRRNAQLILRYWNSDSRSIDEILRIPRVIVFAGHMIDDPERSVPRCPPQFERVLQKLIKDKTDRLQPAFGFSSAACGSDILFLEAMLARGAEVSVVLPYNEEEFIGHSVEIGSNGRDWCKRFERVVTRAARVITASSQRLELGGVSYEFCNQLLLGLAAIRAQQLGTSLVPLAVWNGQEGDGRGGTADVIGNWRSLGYEAEIIKIAGMGESADKKSVACADAANSSFQSRIVAMLFADAVGFSKLTEIEVPRFVEHFLGAVAKLKQNFSGALIGENTWGDGLYFVFNKVNQAGNFALDLADVVRKTNWAEKGLAAEVSLRIALHAGPVYQYEDPITGRRNYSGTHVSRAARIEPITPPGQVYASEAFAALAAAESVKSFACDYVGQQALAKSHGTLPTYHVRRRTQDLAASSSVCKTSAA
jgi:class 3 adenylate cyclase